MDNQCCVYSVVQHLYPMHALIKNNHTLYITINMLLMLFIKTFQFS